MGRIVNDHQIIGCPEFVEGILGGVFFSNIASTSIPHQSSESKRNRVKPGIAPIDHRDLPHPWIDLLSQSLSMLGW